MPENLPMFPSSGDKFFNDRVFIALKFSAIRVDEVLAMMFVSLPPAAVSWCDVGGVSHLCDPVQPLNRKINN